jgi:hypothetical protein
MNCAGTSSIYKSVTKPGHLGSTLEKDAYRTPIMLYALILIRLAISSRLLRATFFHSLRCVRVAFGHPCTTYNFSFLLCFLSI